MNKLYKKLVMANLPIFSVFILGAIAQLIMGLDIYFISKLISWVGLYVIAINVHQWGIRWV
jgi:hypothetical protein